MSTYSSQSPDQVHSFFNRGNMKNYVKFQEASFQNYISLYGVQLEYFARNIDYYDEKGNIRYLFNRQGGLNKKIRDFSYFTGPDCFGFNAMMQIKAILDYGTDNFMFTGFGLDTTNDGKMYITKKQFNQHCLQYFGLPKNAFINLDVSLNILNWKTITDVPQEIYFNPEENLTYKATIQIPEIDVSNIEEGSIKLDNIIKNIGFPATDNTFYSTVYENNRFVEIDDNSVVTEITNIKYDQFGTGTCKIKIAFEIAYNSFTERQDSHYNTLTFDFANNGAPQTITFAPKVGDFVRLKMMDNEEVFRDYEITFVTDVNLDKDSISPYITNFCWECSITRRKPSHEVVDVKDKDGNYVPPMEKGIESVIDNRQTQVVQEITREEEVYDYNDKFADVNGELVENIDYGKDAIFGSLDDADILMPSNIKETKYKGIRGVKDKKIISSEVPDKYIKK